MGYRACSLFSSAFVASVRSNPNVRRLCASRKYANRFGRRYVCSLGSINVGLISKRLSSPENREYVPQKYLTLENGKIGISQTDSQHVRWMLQKDLLGQDMFLLGPPGSKRRQIVMEFLELTQHEVEYVALSRDTTEADLKQRREIRGTTATYFDQCAVRAAIKGRVLILDGIEKAERNVLPVLNNLLENREMHLEDGRFLIPATRYDKLLKEHGEESMKKWQLERVSENFRIIALGIPVPRYPGNALDPPLRSRFQARHIAPSTYEELVSTLPQRPAEELTRHKQLLSFACTVNGLVQPDSEGSEQRLPFDINTQNLPDFPIDSLPKALRILDNNPHISVYEVLSMFYPFNCFINKEFANNVEIILKKFNIKCNLTKGDCHVKYVKKTSDQNEFGDFSMEANLIFNNNSINLHVPHGMHFKENNVNNRNFIEFEYHNNMLIQLIQAHAVSDICVIGPRSCGKSKIAEELGYRLGYNIETMTLYRDMSARELLQQRETKDDNGGNTGWRPSPLVLAAINGTLLILDGLHRLHPSNISILHRLIVDRELQLYDGTRLLRSDRYDKLMSEGLSHKNLSDKGILRIHPAFRIVALAESPTQANNWLTPEVLTLFSFHSMRNLNKEEEIFIINNLLASTTKPLKSVIDLAHLLRTSNDSTMQNLSLSLSTRQLLRIANRMIKYPSTTAYDVVQHTFLAKFLPNIARNALDKACLACSINPQKTVSSRFFKTEDEEIVTKIENGILTIGSTSAPICKTESMTKVPDILFYDIPQHIKLMEWLLQDYIMGNHLLLVGNQGVGKNKIADRLLQLLNKPREYIQLHRDTTVHSLTIQPTVKNGLIIYEDSPLVRAVKNGYVLIIDEADKAPTHVTCVLKSLIEKGEMILGDGRRIIPKHLQENYSSDSNSVITLHEDFKTIVLANRPGFPFLGNNFFASLGDLFSCHAIDNPSVESELLLLEQYGPNVPSSAVSKIVNMFSTLRTMADEGILTYPYSTREVVNIIKHLEKYPDDDIDNAVSNVFDFDYYTPEMKSTLFDVLKEHGFSAKKIFSGIKIEKPAQITIERKSGLDVSGPKHGKIDPEGKPHVGGNTWAGGTGGRDTAGLGGKGGPYRLDAGHAVHQLSDEEKNSVPEEIKKAAREVNRQAFMKKLKEIKMSEFDAKLYGRFLDAIKPQISVLRGTLSSLQARSTERHWVHHQTFGDFDDIKLVEGLTGEQTIYKRRAEQTPLPGTPLNRPKFVRLLTDVSGSMYRFNSYDGRLERSMEVVVLVMESFRGFESQLCYDIWGHSGEADDLQLVSLKHPPKNEKERLQIVRTMHAHSQFCWAGDNTVPAVELSMQQISSEMKNIETSQWDEAILIVLSDANLSRYGIPSSRLAAALTSYKNIAAHIIFIGSLGDQAESLMRELPIGRAHICMDVSTLPQILQQIFASSVANYMVEN